MSNYSIAFGILIGLIFISLVVLFSVIFIKLHIQKIKNYTQVIYQKDIDFQKALTSSVLETQEQVLNNISQDLHDDAGQQLTYINFQLENLKLDLPELQETLAPLSQSVHQLATSIRSVSHSLSNQLVLQQDLIKAISNEVRRIQKNTKVVITYSFEELLKKEFKSDENIFIYRIFQECLNNSFKHAKATLIDITIQTTPLFEMAISDNGKGFDPDSAENKKSLGLLNMKARAASIAYRLEIQAAKGNGTKIILTENSNT